MAFVIIWEFVAKVGQQTAFEAAYGPNGDWVQFFRGGSGYVRTDVLKDTADARRYITIDYWQSEHAYDAFRALHEQEYKAIDVRCEALTESEELIGKFVSLESTPLRK